MERIWYAITDFLTSNIATKVVSIAIALLLWGIVLGSRNVEVTKEIPVEVITPNEMVAANDVPDRISFRLSGPKAFLRAILDRREDPIRVNLTGAKPGVITYRFFSDNIHLPIGVKVQSINPSSIIIKLEPVRRRDVPVKPVLRGVPPDGYRVAKVQVKPEVVRIKGAESKVDGITEIPTVPLDVHELKQPLEREAPLDLSRFNVQIDGPLPRVLINVEAASANYRIKNVDVRVLSPLKARIQEKTVTVLVRADAQDLSQLDRSKVFAVVDLTGKPKGKYREPVRVTLPEEIGLVRVVPEKINVTLY